VDRHHIRDGEGPDQEGSGPCLGIGRRQLTAAPPDHTPLWILGSVPFVASQLPQSDERAANYPGAFLGEILVGGRSARSATGRRAQPPEEQADRRGDPESGQGLRPR
jgi:hypothetical protein